MPEPFPENVAQRNRLAELLVLAAQVEHDVLCQYLFAAATLKQHHYEGVTYGQLEQMRGWKSTIMMVARQEMAHLGIVTNLLTAIGEAPRFDRPDFPAPASILPIDQESRLVRFSEQAVLRFVCFEMPAELPTEEDAAYLRSWIQDFDPTHYDAIYKLYAKVKELLGAIEPDDLFIGPPSAQFVSSWPAVAARGRTPGKGAAPGSIYGFSLPEITGTQSAVAAVEQIVEEGEGAGEHTPTSHFARFLAIHRELVALRAADPGFEPARAVVDDPRTTDLPGATTITNPATIQVSELFDLSYAIMMQLLIRMFAHTDESEEEVAVLESLAFFPLMTTVIRPLSEILAQLPAFDPDQPERAGPSYTFPKRIDLLPHRKAAWRNLGLQLALVEHRGRAVADDSRNPEPLRPRLQLVAEQLARIRFTFENTIGVNVSS
jgi:rubrerythrin